MSEALYARSLINFMVLYLVTGQPHLLCYTFNVVAKGNIMTQCAHVYVHTRVHGSTCCNLFLFKFLHS